MSMRYFFACLLVRLYIMPKYFINMCIFIYACICINNEYMYFRNLKNNISNKRLKKMRVIEINNAFR